MDIHWCAPEVWLKAIDKNVSWLAAEIGIPRSTVRDAVKGVGVPGTDVAIAIVECSLAYQGNGGEAVGFHEIAGVPRTGGTA